MDGEAKEETQVTIEKDSNDEFEMKARIAAKQICEEIQITMQMVLKDIETHDDQSFQGLVCDLVSAFTLGICIRILRDKNLPDVMINQICEAHIAQAVQFSERGRFYQLKEH